MKNVAGLLLVLVVSACSTTSPDVVQRGDAQRLSTVQDATVLSVRPVTVEGTQSGMGSVAGGLVGGVAGSSVGGRREGVKLEQQVLVTEDGFEDITSYPYEEKLLA